jgi:MFS-type transporter involved in bile tolerance (Atg22 family)
MIRIGMRAWGFSLVALLAACAGLAAVSSGAAGTSTVRLSVAATALSIFAALVALLITPREERTRLRSLLWGGLVPLLVGIATALLAGSSGGFRSGLLALLPWLAGVLVAGLLGPVLPSVRLPLLRRRGPADRFSY